jgi:hypothetical protein
MTYIMSCQSIPILIRNVIYSDNYSRLRYVFYKYQIKKENNPVKDHPLVFVINQPINNTTKKHIVYIIKHDFC